MKNRICKSCNKEKTTQHFIKLRSSKTAHYHIREIALSLFDNIPERA